MHFHLVGLNHTTISLPVKNTFLTHPWLAKNNVALFLFAAMLAGLLGARSVNSIGMFLFGLNALRGIPPRHWMQQRWWLLGLVWVSFYAVSWCWSGDKAEWANHVQVKMPFLLLPLAFNFLDPWQPRQLRAFTVIFTVLMLAGAGYSISFMLRDPEAFINGYKFSHTLPTPAYNDHIAFSALTALCISWGCYSWRFWHSATAKVVLGICLAILTVYLHVLAAKTGLMALYLFVLCCLIYLFNKSWKKGLLLLVTVAAGVTLAVLKIPTLKERVNYSIYSFDLYRQGERNGLYSDLGRIHSYDLALRIIRDKPLAGVGAGDVLHEMSAYYEQYYPQIPKEQHLYPHNQLLTIAVAGGLPALIAFLWWIIAPLRRLRRDRDSYFFATFWVMLLVPLMVDPFLEVQAGVFVFVFFFLMQRSLLLKKPDAENIPQDALI